MTAMTKKERVRAALSGEAVDHVPVALWGHDFLREWSPEDLAGWTTEDYRANDWDFIKLNPRWTYFAEAWGAEYERPDQQRHPTPLGKAIGDLAGLQNIEPVGATESVFAEHLRALSLTIEAAGWDVDVVQTIFSPLSVLGLLCGAHRNLIAFAEEEPTTTRSALDAITKTLSEYATESLDAGASGIFYAPLFWSSRDTCTEEFYREFGRPGDLEVLEAIAEAEFNIMHVCRNNNMLESMLDYPVPVFNWADHGEGNLSLTEARARTDKALMGGVDHELLHAMSTEDIETQAGEALASCPDGFFLAGGCGIRPDTPAENRQAVAAAVR